MFYSTGYFPLKHFQLNIHSSNDTVFTQNTLYRLSCQFRMIILLTEMAQPYFTQLLCHVFSQMLGTVFIAHVTDIAQYAVLQILRIRTMTKHLLVMISLNNPIIGTADIRLHLICHTACIRNNTESHTLCFNAVTHIVITVMRNTERSDMKLTYIKRYPFFDDTSQVTTDFALDAITATNADMNVTSGIDR